MIHFTQALKLAGAQPSEPDLAPARERAVGRWAAETHGSEFVAVEGYPMSKRLINAENVREVTLFPRDLHRLTP